MLILGPAMTHFPNFQHDKKLPLNMCSVSVVYLLNSSLVQKIRKK